MSNDKRWPDKKIIGLTGNIATGKSAIMRLAAEKGVLTLDADKIVHNLMNNSEALRRKIEAAFGSGVRTSDGRINRGALANIVFKDPAALARLEALIHPGVRAEVQKHIQLSDAKVVMIEAIKLLEGELKEECDQIWVADCSQQRQIDRLIICRGLAEENARMRVDAQAPQADKVAAANVVIDTNGTLEATRTQVQDAWQALFAPPAPVTPAAAEEAVARRARPSDVPGILLLIHKATDGAVKMKRSELLMAFAERSYFIGQLGAEMNSVIGSYIDSGIARVDQLYLHPSDAIETTAPAVIEMIEKSAREHFCELILIFLPLDVHPKLTQLLEAMEYEQQSAETMHRVWQSAVAESQPEGTFILRKVLRDIRNAARA